jgi:hypothetical protein
VSAKAFELFPWTRTTDAFGTTEEQRPNRAAREYTRGRQGVYLLKKRGVVRYVGSTVAGPDAAPLRMWKTILRHFQECAPVAPGRYGFGDDNWCTSTRTDWRVVLYMLPASAKPETVRTLEASLIARHKPAEQAQKKEPAKPRKKRRT